MSFYIERIPPWVNDSFGLAAVAVALWRGGREERIGALVLAFQIFNEDLPGLRWTQGAPTDVVSLAVFLWMVLRGGRYWTIWAAASSVLSLTTYALHAAIDLGTWAFYSAHVTWSYVLVASLLVGSLQPRGPPAGTDAHAH